MYVLTVFRSTPTCRAMALTDGPWRCKSRIMTGSPSLDHRVLHPAGRRNLGDSVRPRDIPGMPGMAVSHENWRYFKCHKEESCSATHSGGWPASRRRQPCSVSGGADERRASSPSNSPTSTGKSAMRSGLAVTLRRRPRLRGFSGREFEVELRICACGQAQPTAAS